VVREGVGEMNQALYAHMNNKRKMKRKRKKERREWWAFSTLATGDKRGMGVQCKLVPPPPTSTRGQQGVGHLTWNQVPVLWDPALSVTCAKWLDSSTS
jgi:hypothetical protein